MPTATELDIHVLGDRVLVRPDKAQDKTEAGIHLPESSREVPLRGTAVKVGPGRYLESGQRLEMGVKEGDIVRYSRFAGTGTEIEHEGETHLVMREGDILCVLR